MAVVLVTSGTTTQTATGAEANIWPNGAAILGEFQIQFDLNLMAAGDVMEFRVYKMVKTGGTARVLWYTSYAGAQAADAQIIVSDWIANTLTDTNGVEFAIKQTFGTTRALPYAILNRLDFTTANQKVDVDTIKTNPVVNGGTITFPTTATLASTTNITAGTITTVSGNVTGSVGSVTGAVGSVTGNVGGNVTGSVGSVVGAVGSVTGNVGGNVTGSTGSVVGAVGSVTGNVGGNVTGSVGSVVGAVGSVTGNVGGNVTGSVGSVVASVTLTAGQLFIKKNTNLNNFEFVMTDSTNHAPVTGLAVTATRNIDNAGFGACANAVSEVGNGWYVINLAAADLNGSVIAFRMTAAAADANNFTVITQA